MERGAYRQGIIRNGTFRTPYILGGVGGVGHTRLISRLFPYVIHLQNIIWLSTKDSRRPLHIDNV